MKKRAHERIPLDMKVRLLQSNSEYTGIVKNISKNGMYIETTDPLPFSSKFDVHLPFKSRLNVCINCGNNIFEIPVKVKRLVGDDDSFTGMGVMLQTPSRKYMDFISGLSAPN